MELQFRFSIKLIKSDMILPKKMKQALNYKNNLCYKFHKVNFYILVIRILHLNIPFL
ncbi:unnamed protein product [Paramecium octaurelia]|uniref:Uncharacterized protein n=1 Tax=Paramecium octaurelia TaxID=43137 RepID=A0A8S1YJT1_PAROT|nr:unnamed protein product [Paramecium octaurelia]